MFEGDPFDGGDPKYEQPLYIVVIAPAVCF